MLRIKTTPRMIWIKNNFNDGLMDFKKGKKVLLKETNFTHSGQPVVFVFYRQ